MGSCNQKNITHGFQYFLPKKLITGCSLVYL